ncbi:diguanylate cyclase [Burkholderia vietnamiensis]|uniref:Diguanylate cyclase with PAS/PAC sensor n=3 Tax=Burkholderia vietnamiensis TaxID=60552 RepID=A4JNT0_BURVG|nr:MULTISPECIES: sensor domain-containing diguanylate cyclase [Burkholderia]ABO57933.1 diguanylate cyclase with PAS/PAC sensor [Burkholderia vietnamiensis G4]AJY03384.1 diguanylate cyclase domain protein [Burkholderia vietnamiensis LMG 10929]AOJ98641.1 diguanylate cyclase [Burkholderia vietnamiensis]AOK12465.1 diguanylate cyclase [Burkholderia vietnamiensis]AOK43492.1 diguanylate cyclase [Burkholderia vietnamiensis]
MAVKARLLNAVLSTPPSGNHHVTAALRPSMLVTLFEDVRPMALSGIASGFVAAIALIRLQQLWCLIWLCVDVGLLAARLAIARAYVVHDAAGEGRPEYWALRYAPVSLAACFVLGLGVMGCLDSPDIELGTLSVMVAGGVFGGIASRNSALPRLAMTQVTLGVVPIAIGALLVERPGAWLLLPPLAIYLAAMRTVVQRHYRVLVALIAARQRNAELVTRFDAALTYMPHGLCMIDGDSRVIVANRRTAQLFGSPREIMLDTPLPDVIAALGANASTDSDGAGLAAQCDVWLSHDEPVPLDIELADGRQLELTRHRVPDGNAVIIVEDVTARRQTEQHIRHLARHDALTGLPNRHELHAALKRMLSQRPRLPSPALAVMYLDLDGFKSINDRCGHQAGDEVLMQVAERLARALPPGALAARVGGDEFIVALDDTTMHESSLLATRIIGQISAPYTLSIGVTVSLGISIGIALDDGHGNPDELIRQADSALYDAKSAGKGIYRFYSAGSHRPIAPATAN